MSNPQERGMRDMWIGWDDKFPSILEQDHVAPPNTSYKNWIHLREVDPSAPDYKKLAEDLVSSLMVVNAWLAKNKVYEESPGTKMRVLELEYVTESIEAYRAAVGK